jgi:hypothetical protein
MQFIFDNLVATIVAGIAGLLFVAMTMMHGEGTRDQTRLFAHQRGQATFTEMMETDLTNAGILTPSGADPIQAATATSFSFYGLVDEDGTGGLIEYREVPAGTLDGSPVVAVERWVDGVRTGGSGGVLSRFTITPLGDGGTPLGAGSLGSTRAVEVDAEWVIPHAETGDAVRRQAMRRSAWTTYLRPIGLQP